MKPPTADLADALKQLDYPKLDGLIIDLRNNGGGLLNQAVGMADMFLDKNELVVSHRGRRLRSGATMQCTAIRASKFRSSFWSTGKAHPHRKSLSGAIQDHDRGLIVGETSFGKGLVQTQYSAERRHGDAAHHRALLHPERPPDPARLQECLALRLPLQSASRPNSRK